MEFPFTKYIHLCHVKPGRSTYIAKTTQTTEHIPRGFPGRHVNCHSGRVAVL